jgi:hypothetical protein
LASAAGSHGHDRDHSMRRRRVSDCHTHRQTHTHTHKQHTAHTHNYTHQTATSFLPPLQHMHTRTHHKPTHPIPTPHQHSYLTCPWLSKHLARATSGATNIALHTFAHRVASLCHVTAAQQHHRPPHSSTVRARHTRHIHSRPSSKGQTFTRTR